MYASGRSLTSKVSRRGRGLRLERDVFIPLDELRTIPLPSCLPSAIRPGDCLREIATLMSRWRMPMKHTSIQPKRCSNFIPMNTRHLRRSPVTAAAGLFTSWQPMSLQLASTCATDSTYENSSKDLPGLGSSISRVLPMYLYCRLGSMVVNGTIRPIASGSIEAC